MNMQHTALFLGVRATVLALVATSFISSAAAAALDLDRKPTLRAAVAVNSDVVTVGDFFEGAGTVGPTPIFRSPDLGQTGTVSAAKVIAAARAAGLYDADPGSLVDVVVTHEAREFGQDDVAKLVADTAMKQFPLPDGSNLVVAFDQPIEPQRTDPHSDQPMRIASLSYWPATGRFDALVMLDQGNGVERLRVRGTATEMVPTPTITHDIARGDVIAPDAVTLTKLPRHIVGSARPADPDQIIGQAARRPLRAGQSVGPADVMPPVLVTRGDTITLVYEVPGLVLTTRAQAMDSGIRGETVGVMNPQSKRIVHGIVVAAGKVQVSGGVLTASADPQP
ncbi:MAG: flagellar basal body P-ring formation chaperone FlgA [Ancalomicrobiaceae bacterium]|nr:flagellar basal body P-ring formation chaperone FlgA [Ancalomicrobiaceae bacterium]